MYGIWRTQHSPKIIFDEFGAFYFFVFFLCFCNNCRRTPNNAVKQVVRLSAFWIEKTIFKFKKVWVQRCVDLNFEEFRYCAELETFSFLVIFQFERVRASNINVYLRKTVLWSDGAYSRLNSFASAATLVSLNNQICLCSHTQHR